MPGPLIIIPIILAALGVSVGVSGCPTPGRPEEDDDDTVPVDDDDDDTVPMDDDDDSSVSSPVDADEDTYYTCDFSEQSQYEDILCGDCDDSDATVYPTADESTQNGVDNDCDESIDEDYVEPNVCEGVTGLRFNENPFVIEGEDEYDGMGTAVSGGDIDGDGVSDLVLGSGAAWDETLETMGKVYGVLGGDNIVPGGFMLVTEADATWTGSTEEAGLGGFVATVDLDGNGQADILMTSEDNINVVYNPLDANPTTAVLQGGGIFGPRLFVIPDVDEVGGPGELVVGGNGAFDIIPLENIGSGTQSIDSIRRYHVAGVGYTIPDEVSAGDMDGDGLAEVAFGDTYDDNTSDYTASGKTYLVKGGSWESDEVSLSPTGSSGAEIAVLTGTVAGEYVGSALAAGDVDGDGLADLFIGAPGTDNGDPAAGALHEISSWADIESLYGETEVLGVGGTLDLEKGLVVYGGVANGALPDSIVVVSDTTCGLSALVAGVVPYGDDANGRVFVLGASTLAALVGVENAEVDDEADQIFEGEDNNGLGWKVAAIGDVNGDGVPDFAAVAPTSDLRGQVHVYLGERI